MCCRELSTEQYRAPLGCGVEVFQLQCPGGVGTPDKRYVCTWLPPGVGPLLGSGQGSLQSICTKMQHYGAGTGQDKGWWGQIQDVVGGQGTAAVPIYPGFSFYINLQYFMFISPIVPNINASCAIML